MHTGKEKNRPKMGGLAGGTPAARRREPSTSGETARSGPIRGYIKLSDAVNFFDFDFKDKIVLDIGSSTGGFTELALKHGAKKVIAVEKGTNQMKAPLRYDPRVELHEKTDIFDTGVHKESFEGGPELGKARSSAARPWRWAGRTRPEKELLCAPDVIIADVSFLSLTKILKHAKIHLSRSDTDFLVMLKPQFEAKPYQLNKGVVKNEKIRREIIKNFEQWLKQNGFIIIKKRDNNLAGKNGNLERFYWLRLAK
ncbi:hypothetical protein IIY68_00880 [Candidatus Saccharibacteria bacterium]|nr:hypothetical protein [Candidatus Saccharibacteria bacterium]